MENRPLTSSDRGTSLLHVGLDDTDSSEGMCTTYLAAVLIDEIKSVLGLTLDGFLGSFV